MSEKQDNIPPTNQGAVTRTGQWRKPFIVALRQSGNYTIAARMARVSRRTYLRERDRNPRFATACREALKTAYDLMEREAHRRAVTGVRKPVYQSGKRVGYIREYSDTLLMFMLKGARPSKYRDNYRVEHTGKNGGPIKTQLDLSRLNVDELRSMRALIGKASNQADAHTNN